MARWVNRAKGGRAQRAARTLQHAASNLQHATRNTRQSWTPTPCNIIKRAARTATACSLHPLQPAATPAANSAARANAPPHAFTHLPSHSGCIASGGTRTSNGSLPASKACCSNGQPRVVFRTRCRRGRGAARSAKQTNKRAYESSSTIGVPEREGHRARRRCDVWGQGRARMDGEGGGRG